MIAVQPFQNPALYLYLLVLILLLTPQTLSPSFLDVPLSSTEDLCHLYHHPSALAQGLLFKPSHPHRAGTLPLSATSL